MGSGLEGALPGIRAPVERLLVEALLSGGLVEPTALRELLTRRAATDLRPLPVLLQDSALVSAADLEPVVARIRAGVGSSAPTTRPAASSARVAATRADAPSRPRAAASARQPAQVDRLELAPGVEVKIERALGRGGMGEVLLVHDPRLGRRAALKLALDAVPDSRRALRFRRETIVTARLDHPNIPPVFEAGTTTTGRDYLLMRFVDGRVLTRALRDLHEPDEPDAAASPAGDAALRGLVAALVRVGEAVAYAHSKGVIHRDLKPDNIMVGAFGEVLVMDWGLARVLRESADEDRSLRDELREPAAPDGAALTQAGACLGTLGYMPPEQARGGDVDPRADVYALGAVLCEVITGQVPLRTESALEMLAQTLSGQAEVPVHAGAPPELRAVARRALAASPDDRYADMPSMIEDLRAWLEGRPVSAYRYPPLELARRWIRRHPATVAGLVVAFVGLVLASGAIARARSRAADAARTQAEAGARSEARKDALAARAAQPASAALAERLGAALATLQAAQRWRALSPGDAEADGCLFDAACGLGEVALEGEQWALAREGFQQAAKTTVDDARAARLLARTDRLAGEEARRRREAIEGELERLATDASSATADGVRDAVFVFVRHQEPQTVGLLATALDRISARLGELERWAYGEVATQDNAERSLGVTALTGVDEAWVRRSRGEATPEDVALLSAAGERLISRAERAMPVGMQVKLRLTQLLAGRQSAGLTPGEVALAAATTEALGRLGLRATALPALCRYLAAEQDPVRASHAGVALARLGGPEALAALRAAVGRLGWHGTFTAQARRALAGVDLPLDLEGKDAAALLALAHELRALGRTREAVLTYDRVIAQDATRAEAWTARALARADLGQRDEGIADCTRALELDPTLAVAWNNRGYLRLCAGAWASGAEDCARATELAPEEAVHWSNLAWARIELKQPAEAFAAADRALTLDPTLALALCNRARARLDQGDTEAALADFERALALDPDDANALLSRARCLHRLGRRALAREAYDRAIARDPTSGPALGDRGCLRAEQGDASGGLADCDRAVELSPDRAEVWMQRAQVQMLLGRLDPARADAVRSCELMPGWAEAWSLRSVVLYHLGDHRAAIAAAEEALRLDPRMAKAWNGRGLARAATGELGPASEDLGKAVELEPTSALFLSNLGFVLLRRGERPAAIEALGRAIERDPGMAVAWSNRGLTRLELGDLASARDDLARAVELDPTLGLSWCNLAVARSRLGDADGAMAAIDSAVQRAPTTPNVWAIRAELRLARDDARGAIEDASEALRLDPRQAEALATRGMARCRLGERDGAIPDLEASLRLSPGGPLAAGARRALAEAKR